MTGKNFSCNNTGKRKKSDFYETPYSITQQLLDAESENIDKNKYILEPACGNGAIVKILSSNGFKVIGQDLEIGQDFLLNTKKYDYVITNPPFSLAFEFIQKCKEISNYFALLLPLSYLHGKKRFDNIYSDTDFKLEKVYVFTRYPMLGDKLRDDGKYKTGMMVYAWFVWNKNYSGEPVIKWIDNNSFVLSKTDN